MASEQEFLQAALDAARSRLVSDCCTVGLELPAFAGQDGAVAAEAEQDAPTGDCAGSIVLYLSKPLLDDWMGSAPGPAGSRRLHVLGQLNQVLQELAEHGLHGYLSLNESQCDVYGQDLAQLVAEALGRTSFDRLARRPAIHWEGTLVKALLPPTFVLAVSVGLAPAGQGADP